MNDNNYNSLTDVDKTTECNDLKLIFKATAGPVSVHTSTTKSESGFIRLFPARELGDYFEKEIDGVTYRVQSIFSDKGDFQKLYAKLLISRVLKHYRHGRVRDAAGNDREGGGVTE